LTDIVAGRFDEGRLTVNDPELAIRAALDGVGVLYTALGYDRSWHIAVRCGASIRQQPKVERTSMRRPPGGTWPQPPVFRVGRISVARWAFPRALCPSGGVRHAYGFPYP
jgi:hypothetical protein